MACYPRRKTGASSEILIRCHPDNITDTCCLIPSQWSHWSCGELYNKAWFMTKLLFNVFLGLRVPWGIYNLRGLKSREIGCFKKQKAVAFITWRVWWNNKIAVQVMLKMLNWIFLQNGVAIKFACSLYSSIRHAVNDKRSEKRNWEFRQFFDSVKKTIYIKQQIIKLVWGC